jgi:hypothetical protein
LPAEQKMALSDYVVWTEGGLDVLDAQLQRIFPRRPLPAAGDAVCERSA